MAFSDHKAVYRRIIEAINAGDEPSLLELLAEDLVDHNPIPDQVPGAAGFVQWMRSARASFPDLMGTIEDLIGEDDRVAARVIWRGTHRGAFVGVPPTDRSVSFEAFHVVRISGGRAAEWWGVADLFAALSQVGAAIRPPE